MPRNEDSSPGHRRGVNGVAPAAGPDDETGIRIGLALQVLGSHLAEHFRIRRQLTAAQRGAASARLAAILDGIGGDIDALKIGMRAMARADLG